MSFTSGDTPETPPESQPGNPAPDLSQCPPEGEREEEGAGLFIRIERVPWELIGYGLIFLVALVMRPVGARTAAPTTTTRRSTPSIAGGSPTARATSTARGRTGRFCTTCPRSRSSSSGTTWPLPGCRRRSSARPSSSCRCCCVHRLGMWGALAASAMLAFSPTLFYFSRFIRNDVLTLVFELALVISMWRFLETRRNVWLFAAAGGAGAGLLVQGDDVHFPGHRRPVPDRVVARRHSLRRRPARWGRELPAARRAGSTGEPLGPPTGRRNAGGR